MQDSTPAGDGGSTDATPAELQPRFIFQPDGEHLAFMRPASAPGFPTGTEARVCGDIARRQMVGIRKYGTTVADNPLALRAWLQHAYEEALDLAIYLRRAIEKLDALAGPPEAPAQPTDPT